MYANASSTSPSLSGNQTQLASTLHPPVAHGSRLSPVPEDPATPRQARTPAMTCGRATSGPVTGPEAGFGAAGAALRPATPRYDAAMWLFAKASAMIRSGQCGLTAVMLNKLPPQWIYGVIPASDDDAMSINIDNLPSLYGRAGDHAFDIDAPPPSQSRRTAAFEPYRGPQSPTGSQWRLSIPAREPLLAHAARFGNTIVIDKILDTYGHETRLDYRDPDGYSLLHLAAWSGVSKSVARLLDESRRRYICPQAHIDPLPVDMPGPDGETVLHIALLLANPPLFQTALNFNADRMVQLNDIDAGNEKFLTSDARMKLLANQPLRRSFENVHTFGFERARATLIAIPDKRFVYSPLFEGALVREDCCVLS